MSASGMMEGGRPRDPSGRRLKEGSDRDQRAEDVRGLELDVEASLHDDIE